MQLKQMTIEFMCGFHKQQDCKGTAIYQSFSNLLITYYNTDGTF